MKIAIGCDQACSDHKQNIIDHLRSLGHDVEDLTVSSTSKEMPMKEALANVISQCSTRAGILICGETLNNIDMSEHSHSVRAVVCSEPHTAELSKKYNNTNALVYSSKTVGVELAKMIIDSWLTAKPIAA